MSRSSRAASRAAGCMVLIALIVVAEGSILGGGVLRRAPHMELGGGQGGREGLVSASLRRQQRMAGSGLILGIMAKAKDAKAAAEELHAERVRKFARSVDQVIGSTLSGYVGPWTIGMLIGSISGAKGGFKAAMRNGVNNGNSWGIMSATFCGLEVGPMPPLPKHLPPPISPPSPTRH